MAASIVTISAPYGTGGAVISPAVARYLDVPFLDRAIPLAVARALEVPVGDALAHDELTEARFSLGLDELAGSPRPPSGPEVTEGQLTKHVYRAATERVMLDAAQSTGCVILGRAAVMVLRDVPGVLHVCLGGSFERRVERGLALSLDDEETVRGVLKETDQNRISYFHHVYDADPDDPRLYHLVIDTTVLDFETSVDLIVAAGRARTNTVA
jgi:cytidylate kinase